MCLHVVPPEYCLDAEGVCGIRDLCQDADDNQMDYLETYYPEAFSMDQQGPHSAEAGDPMNGIVQVNWN